MALNQGRDEFPRSCMSSLGACVSWSLCIGMKDVKARIILSIKPLEGVQSAKAKYVSQRQLLLLYIRRCDLGLALNYTEEKV